MDCLDYTILGCGSSGGVPRLGGNWGDCDPSNPKNTRRRCSLLVERISDRGKTSVLIDTSPDMRAQLLDASVGALNAVVYTHEHADHVHGLDDLRMIVINMQARLPVYASPQTSTALLTRFGYCFETPKGSDYPPILDLNPIDGPITIEGEGGTITLEPFEVEHGRITSLGFRIHDVAYLPDVSAIPEKSWGQLQNLDTWIVDALKRTPHPSHSHLAQTLDWIERAAPKNAVITNMHIDMDYDAVQRDTPANVTPAYDGLKITKHV